MTCESDNLITHHEPTLPSNGIVGVKPSMMISGELGVQALETIEAGKVIFKIKGPVIPKPTKYTFQIGIDKHLVPQDDEGKPGFGHFTNHSCNPSAYIRISSNNNGEESEIEVITRREIQAGSEVTVDYAAMEFAPTATGLECKCGSDKCRKIITGYKDLTDDVKRLYIEEGIISAFLLELDRDL